MRHAFVAALRQQGVDVLTALEAGMIQQTDEQQLSFAAAQERAIYSFNVADFCRLHRDWFTERGSHSGIIVAQQHQFPLGEQVRRLARLVDAMSSEAMRNRLEFLGDWG